MTTKFSHKKKYMAKKGLVHQFVNNCIGNFKRCASISPYYYIFDIYNMPS